MRACRWGLVLYEGYGVLEGLERDASIDVEGIECEEWERSELAEAIYPWDMIEA